MIVIGARCNISGRKGDATIFGIMTLNEQTYVDIRFDDGGYATYHSSFITHIWDW